MSDTDESIDIPEEVKKEKTRPKQVMTPERLEALARAREKGLAIRKQNAELRGKKVVREEKKQIADKNKVDAETKFKDAVNQRVEEELAKRMNDLNTDKINQILDEKLKDFKSQAEIPKKPRKKIVYEETETESEAEVIKVVRKKPPVPVPVVVPDPIPVPVPDPVPVQPKVEHQFNQFTNLLRSIPRANRNPYS